MSFFFIFEAGLGIVKRALRDVAQQNKSTICPWFFMHDADYKFLMFCVPLSIVGRLVSMFSCNLNLVLIGAPMEPTQPIDGLWPMGRFRDFGSVSSQFLVCSTPFVTRVNRAWN